MDKGIYSTKWAVIKAVRTDILGVVSLSDSLRHWTHD